MADPSVSKLRKYLNPRQPAHKTLFIDVTDKENQPLHGRKQFKNQANKSMVDLTFEEPVFEKRSRSVVHPVDEFHFQQLYRP